MWTLYTTKTRYHVTLPIQYFRLPEIGQNWVWRDNFMVEMYELNSTRRSQFTVGLHMSKNIRKAIKPKIEKRNIWKTPKTVTPIWL